MAWNTCWNFDGKNGKSKACSQQRVVGLLARIGDKIFGHRPPPGYKLAWEYSIGFFTQCRFCGKAIVRQYDGEWCEVKRSNL
jgi:hypothetical protein